jgi:type I restriction enzyme S subunit
MEVKKGYKQTEVGIIPEDWDVLSIGDVGKKFLNGGTPSTQIMEYWAGTIPWITGADLVNQKVSNTRRFITTKAINNSSTNLVEKGNLLIATRTGVGKLAIAPFDVAISQDLTGVYPNEDKVVSQYLFRYLEFHATDLRSQNQGTSIEGITRETLLSIKILVPPIPEQHLIATVLSDTDTLLSALDNLIAKKRLIKQGAMQELLTGKRRLPGFSGEWETVKFEDLADKKNKWSITGGPFGSNLKASEYVSEGVRIIQLQNIGDGVFYDDYAIYTSEQKADELISSNIFPDEIILSKMGDPVARACLVPTTDCRYLMASDGIRLAVDKKRFDKRFVFYYINSIYFRRKAIEASTGTTRQRIGLTDLKKLPFIALSLPEQYAIGDILSDIEAEIASLEARLKKTRLLKQGMMQELLTGRIRLI